jgi:PleD family two-component response regulator
MLRDDTDQSAIKRADELMYKSKMDGRNRVTLG